MKALFIYLTGILLSLSIYAQQKQGVSPYEMKDRKEHQPPVLNFADCNQWNLEFHNCQATLSQTKEQFVFDQPSARITYQTTRPNAVLFLNLKKPIRLLPNWNCIDVWTFGDHWFWGEPNMGTAMQVYAVFTDKHDKQHEINLVQSGYPQFAHKYWFLNHLKYNNKSGYTHFLGFRLKGNSTDVGTEHKVYFNNIYLYQEVLKPMTFKSLPDTLPFPVRKETILPVNKCREYNNNVLHDNGTYRFTYTEKENNLTYLIHDKQPFGKIEVVYNNRTVEEIENRRLIMAEGDTAHISIQKVILRNDTLFMNCLASGKKEKSKLTIWYTIRQKSLIFNIKEEGKWGKIQAIQAGAVYAPTGKQIPIPFLKYNYSDRITTLYNKDLFSLFMFDWYYTNASEMTTLRPNKDTYASSMAIYIPRTDGKRNPLQEKIFYTVSPDVHEVFPTIDNPVSPMRSTQADRLWLINGDTDLSRLAEEVINFRSRGLDKVTVRYHEGFWREDGESYTFRLTPSPALGVEKIQNYVDFVKSKGWRVGLYSNYTDMTTVNALWNPNWMKQNPQGQWEVSWARCYAPKPQIAWEQQAILAPQIHRLFNTNHSYCDVHTAVSPMSRVDYDYRVPEAGMMKGVIKRYGLLLMNERNAYNSPVYSEGGNHWWYAGLADGNYANEQLLELPVFPDFSLLKIHPLEMDAANTGEGYQYLAYALAYGNQGILSQGNDAIMRYAFLQPLQNDFVMIPVKQIRYCSEGAFYDTSDAIKKDILHTPQLLIEYESGLNTYVNFSKSPWKIEVEGIIYTLPTYGFFAYNPGKNLKSMSILSETSKRIDRVYSNELLFFKSDEEIPEGKLCGKGNYLLKKETFGWEIIPLDKDTQISFDLSLIGLKDSRVKIVGVDRDGKVLNELQERFHTKVSFAHQPIFYKYQIIPTNQE